MTRRFPAPSLPAPGEQVQLDAPTSHHVLRVALIPRGARLVLFDGGGAECPGRLVDVRGGRAVVEATGPARAPPAPIPPVHLMGMPRRPPRERVLRMGTELGVTAFRPFPARRSVARGLKPARWEALVRSAAAQCGRADAPRVAPATDLDAALADLPPLPRYALTPGAPRLRAVDGGAILLVGPEGGLAPDEGARAAEAGFEPAGLGPWTLRADTAAVSALALFAVRAGAPAGDGSVGELGDGGGDLDGL